MNKPINIILIAIIVVLSFFIVNSKTANNMLHEDNSRIAVSLKHSQDKEFIINEKLNVLKDSSDAIRIKYEELKKSIEGKRKAQGDVISKVKALSNDSANKTLDSLKLSSKEILIKFAVCDSVKIELTSLEDLYRNQQQQLLNSSLMHKYKDTLMLEKISQLKLKDDLIENKDIEIKLLKKDKRNAIIKSGVIGSAIGFIAYAIISRKN